LRSSVRETICDGAVLVILLMGGTKKRQQKDIEARTAKVGVTARDCEIIRGAFVYEGFGYDLDDPQIAAQAGQEVPAEGFGR
jgi:hypothetical protein